MFILYEIVFFLYCITYAPFLKLTGRWHPGFRQRLGQFTPDEVAKLGHSRSIWVHAVSVGEVAAVSRFIEQMRDRWPGIGIICSVTTVTGYEYAQKRFGTTVTVIFSPVDFSLITSKIVKLIKPKMYISVETEIWPNLFKSLHKQKIPIAVINGRISDRSFGQYKMVRGMLRKVLSYVNIFAMQSEVDAARIKELGAPADRVWCVGNIKFDDLPKAEDAQMHVAGFAPKGPLWIAGSTHPGEEKIILDVFKQLKKTYPQWELVIAPRHVQRVKEISDLVKASGFNYALFSQSRMSRYDPNAVTIVDTIGHLKSLYAYASLVFVGKSLCVGGGHNIIEPAFFAKPVIVGERMENFRDVLAYFKKDQAVVVVRDRKELAAKVDEMMGDPNKRVELGRRAKATIDHNQGAGYKIMQLIALCL